MNLFRKKESQKFNLENRRSSMNRIIGTEHELGIEFADIENEKERDDYLYTLLNHRVQLVNGGRFYEDMNHMEMCTPETNSALEEIKYEKALERICLKFIGKKFNPIVYKNNTDGKEKVGTKETGNSFGAHENYSTTLKSDNRDDLLLFGIVQKIFTGSGYLSPQGRFEITQRARFITRDISEDTRTERGILNIKDESFGGEELGIYRFHHISNDANMCQGALLLKLGTMHLMLKLLEENLFPRISYNSKKAVSDLRTISRQTSNWTIEGTHSEHRSALAVMDIYWKTAREELYGIDSETNLIIDYWKDTIEKLKNIDSYPDALRGRLDWVSKKSILEELIKADDLSWEHSLIQSNALDYHRIDPEGLFYQMEELDFAEKFILEEEIQKAINIPPETRAQARGRILEMYNKMSKRKGERLVAEWGYCKYLVDEAHDNIEKILWVQDMPNPHDTYDDAVKDFQRFLIESGRMPKYEVK